MTGFPCTMQCEACRRIMTFSAPPTLCVCGVAFQLPDMPMAETRRLTCTQKTPRRRVEHFRLVREKSGEFFSYTYKGEPGSFISIGAQDGARITCLTLGHYTVVKHKDGEEVPLDALRGVVFDRPYEAGEPITVTASEAVHITLVLEEYQWS